MYLFISTEYVYLYGYIHTYIRGVCWVSPSHLKRSFYRMPTTISSSVHQVVFQTHTITQCPVILYPREIQLLRPQALRVREKWTYIYVWMECTWFASSTLPARRHHHRQPLQRPPPEEAADEARARGEIVIKNRYYHSRDNLLHALNAEESHACTSYNKHSI